MPEKPVPPSVEVVLEQVEALLRPLPVDYVLIVDTGASMLRIVTADAWAIGAMRLLSQRIERREAEADKKNDAEEAE